MSFGEQGGQKEDEDQYLDVNDQVYGETNNGATAGNVVCIQNRKKA